MGDLEQNAIAIVGLVIACAVGVTIFENFNTAQQTTYSVTNETFACNALGTAITNLTAAKSTTLISLTPVKDQGGSWVVYNQTGGLIAGQHAYNYTGNWTLDTETGYITCSAGGLLVAYRNYSISYTYITGGAGHAAVAKGITGVAEFPNWIQVLVIILIAAVILNQLGMFKQV